MTRQCALVVVVSAVAAGGIAFYLGRAEIRQSSWRKNAPHDAIERDRQFEEQARRLADSVRAEQVTLSTMLADVDSTGPQILAQVGRTTESYGTLIRTVGWHLVGLRDGLPRSQAKALMQSCASSVRGQVQKRYRWRGGAQGEMGGHGYMGGRGTTGRRGRGGPGYRGGQNEDHAQAQEGVVCRLLLTAEQAAWIQQQDPNFELDCTLLADRLNQVHTEVAASLEDAAIDGQTLLNRLDELVEAHRELEERIARYLVLLRPHLSTEQREHLSELCGGSGAIRRGTPAQHRPADSGSLAAGLLPRLAARDSL
ncbi:MAG: hypothetical protein KBE65_00020 [Phycisphaerae bacterium]|nr:hypothetical protein [Phycisphaerae bacterium]